MVKLTNVLRINMTSKFPLLLVGGLKTCARRLKLNNVANNNNDLKKKKVFTRKSQNPLSEHETRLRSRALWDMPEHAPATAPCSRSLSTLALLFFFMS